ncbi:MULTISPECIES: hypothetical protein [unclassified Mesorhizobium]|uniref:hypothetical protein n=1 Tax=unclassified Mesorhizobium TaxID=325217 RepID=UPI0030145516
MTRILLVLTALTVLSGGLLAGCASDDGYASWSKREETMTPLKKRTDRGGGLSGN